MTTFLARTTRCRPPTLALAAALLAPLAAPPTAAAAEAAEAATINEIRWPDARTRLRRASGEAPQPPAGPRFLGPMLDDAGPDSPTIRACGRLDNPLHEPIVIRYFSANPAGPLILIPEEGGVLRRRPRAPGEPPLPPPAPPPLMQFDVPARGSVGFCAETSLAPFDFEPGRNARIRWHFDWKNPPAGYPDPLDGVLTIRLP